MISRHFRRSEFACGCGCGFATADIELVKLLELIREHFGMPVTINSACRCESHNEAIGGADGSKHKLGIAADIVVRGVEPKEVCAFVNKKCPVSTGIGCYKTFTHIDVRERRARW